MIRICYFILIVWNVLFPGKIAVSGKPSRNASHGGPDGANKGNSNSEANSNSNANSNSKDNSDSEDYHDLPH